MYGSNASPYEASYINWNIQHTFNQTALREVTATNFQDIYNLTKRVGEVNVKEQRIKFRAQGIGGMLGIAAGALGGPLGSVIGFGIGRSLGSYVGNVLSNRYYGAEKAAVNENLFLARQRDPQLKYQLGVYGQLGTLIQTFQQNKIKADQKLVQDMMVL